jgi:hypothetical protein
MAMISGPAGLAGIRPKRPLAIVLAASTMAFVAVEIEKWVRRRRDPEGLAGRLPVPT